MFEGVIVLAIFMVLILVLGAGLGTALGTRGDGKKILILMGTLFVFFGILDIINWCLS